ncbi:hypothetical protein [Oceanispirochaeta sp. M2]|nr:hypothetical protein [Oceanispirochaeta sp. M2]
MRNVIKTRIRKTVRLILLEAIAFFSLYGIALLELDENTIG